MILCPPMIPFINGLKDYGGLVVSLTCFRYRRTNKNPLPVSTISEVLETDPNKYFQETYSGQTFLPLSTP